MLTRKLERSIDQDRELERKRNAFISKGGSVSSEQKEGWTHINLRIRKDMIEKIDHIIENDRIGMNRTSWILESVQRALKENE